MGTYPRNLLALSLLLAICSQAPCWEDEDKGISPKEALKEMNEVLIACQESKWANQRLDRRYREMLYRMRENLKLVLTNTEGREVPKEYVETLRGDIELMRQIKQDSEETTVQDVIEAVSRDMQAKADAFKVGAGSNPFKVEVEANTKNARGWPIPNLQVYCVQKGFTTDKKRYQKFERPSTPTCRLTSPGYWVLWCEEDKVGGKTGAKQDVTVVPQPSAAKQKVNLPSP